MLSKPGCVLSCLIRASRNGTPAASNAVCALIHKWNSHYDQKSVSSNVLRCCFRVYALPLPQNDTGPRSAPEFSRWQAHPVSVRGCVPHVSASMTQNVAVKLNASINCDHTIIDYPLSLPAYQMLRVGVLSGGYRPYGRRGEMPAAQSPQS
jgi:hypothetical protein